VLRCWAVCAGVAATPIALGRVRGPGGPGCLGVALFGEPVTLLRVGSVVLIVLGLVGLKLGTP